MARTQTMVQLSDELLALLDDEAARLGVSRSAVIRRAVVAHLNDDATVTARIVDGYRRVPPATPDAWGDLSALGELGTLESAQRLDAEERAGGEPW